MIHTINHLAASWWDWMWPMFWQATIIIVLVAAVDRVLRRRVWPEVRYTLWLLVLLKLAVPPMFSLSTSVTSGFPLLVRDILEPAPGADGTRPGLSGAAPAAASPNVTGIPLRHGDIVAPPVVTSARDGAPAISAMVSRPDG